MFHVKPPMSRFVTLSDDDKEFLIRALAMHAADRRTSIERHLIGIRNQLGLIEEHLRSEAREQERQQHLSRRPQRPAA